MSRRGEGHRLAAQAVVSQPGHLGIGGAPEVQGGPGEFSLEFAATALPPLAALGAITVGER